MRLVLINLAKGLDGAPALVALLRNELDSPAKRLEAVLQDSCLAHLDALEWSDFGA